MKIILLCMLFLLNCYQPLVIDNGLLLNLVLLEKNGKENKCQEITERVKDDNDTISVITIQGEKCLEGEKTLKTKTWMKCDYGESWINGSCQKTEDITNQSISSLKTKCDSLNQINFKNKKNWRYATYQDFNYFFSCEDSKYHQNCTFKNVNLFNVYLKFYLTTDNSLYETITFYNESMNVEFTSEQYIKSNYKIKCLADDF